MKIFNTISQEIVYVCLVMFNCLRAEQATAIRKRKFLRQVFVANAKKELQSLLTNNA